MSLATKKMAKRYAKARQQTGNTDDGDGEIDLFNRHHIRGVRRRIKATTELIDGKLEELKVKVKGNDEGQSHEDTIRIENSMAEATAVATCPKVGELSRNVSTNSKASKKSKSSLKKEHPVFDEPAPALDSNEEDEDDHAFDHPATYVDQPWIWLPKDLLGLSEVLVSELKAAGVDASDVGAMMDEKGVVEVTRNPPDEEWSGGQDS